MSDNVIQQQISLLDFKAVKTSFELVEEDEDNITEPEFNFNLNNILFSADPKLFAKSFVVNLTVILENTNHILKLNVEFHTIFRCLVDIDDSFLESDFVKISAPAIGFPYLRAFVSTVTLQAGFPPVILPSINFVQLSKNEENAKIKT